jgi:class 3 adenylate cyclase
MDPKIPKHRGRIVKTTGDGALVEFASPVEAVRCAAGVKVVSFNLAGRLWRPAVDESENYIVLGAL